jgi:hypothetical protein
MHRAQVRLEAIESSIEIEIGIEIDSVQFYASARFDLIPIPISISISNGASPNLGFVHNAFC